MKRLLVCLAVLTIAPAPAWAGPNETGAIVVHNTGVAWTTDLSLPPASPVPRCVEINSEIPMGSAPYDQSMPLVWKVYASFPVSSSPRLKGCGWGVSMTNDGAGQIVILGNDAPSPAVLYITSAGWPGNNTFIRMSFTDGVRTDAVNELFWFGGYAYAGTAGEPQSFAIIPHSTPSNRFFFDDAVPANADPIAGYGTLGFGQPGVLPCVDCILPCASACCHPDGTCAMLTPDGCQAAGGTYLGGDTICTPTLCSSTPVEHRSWGRIKNSYR